MIRKRDLGLRLRIIYYVAGESISSGCECEAYGDISLTSSDSNRSSKCALVITSIIIMVNTHYCYGEQKTIIILKAS